MKRFSIEKLPKKVKERIDFIEWNEGDFDECVCGLVWLKNGYVFYYDESTTDTFTNRKDLIELIKYNTIKTNVE